MSDRVRAAGKRDKALFSGLYFTIYAVYLWRFVQPDLIALRQDPAILMDSDYLVPLMNRPGAVVQAIADLILQLFFFPGAGVLILTALAAVLTLATLGILKRAIAPDTGFCLAHIPSVLLLSLHSQYSYSLATTLSLTLAALSLWLYLAVSKRPLLRIWRLPLLWFLTGILHFVGGGASFYFTLCVFLFELLFAKRIFTALLAAVPALLLPLFSARLWFIVTLTQASLHLLPLDAGADPAAPLVLLLAFYPALMILAALLARFNLSLWPWTARIVRPIPALLLLCAAAAAAWLAHDPSYRVLLQIEQRARARDWTGVLELAQRHPCTMLGCSFQTNRSLCLLGRLGDDMFRYPQPWDVEGLFLPKNYALSAPLRNSDFYFDIGFINEAQHWAHEALSHIGPTPWILRRLALIYLLKREWAAAEKFALALDRTPFHRKWAQPIRDMIENPEKIAADSLLSRIQTLAPDRDLICYTDFGRAELIALLESRSNNSLALDYLLAFDLLQCRVANFVKDLERFWPRKNSPLPRHYQEALLFYVMLSRNRNLEFGPKSVSPQTRARFVTFSRVLASHRGDKDGAKRALRREFGDTYWYYLTTFEFPDRPVPGLDPAGPVASGE